MNVKLVLFVALVVLGVASAQRGRGRGRGGGGGGGGAGGRRGPPPGRGKPQKPLPEDVDLWTYDRQLPDGSAAAEKAFKKQDDDSSVQFVSFDIRALRPQSYSPAMMSYFFPTDGTPNFAALRVSFVPKCYILEDATLTLAALTGELDTRNSSTSNVETTAPALALNGTAGARIPEDNNPYENVTGLKRFCKGAKLYELPTADGAAADDEKELTFFTFFQNATIVVPSRPQGNGKGPGGNGKGPGGNGNGNGRSRGGKFPRQRGQGGSGGLRFGPSRG